MLLYFFFQAEDGIRDGTVTGVQTCALPIYNGGYSPRLHCAFAFSSGRKGVRPWFAIVVASAARQEKNSSSECRSSEGHGGHTRPRTLCSHNEGIRRLHRHGALCHVLYR